MGWIISFGEIAYSIEIATGAGSDYDSLVLENEIRDDQLRMMFACCHPAPRCQAQVAPTLKTLCGSSKREIAAALLPSPATVAKRLVRARHKMRDDRTPFEIPAGADFSTRLDATIQVLNLLHDAGYKPSDGDKLVGGEMCNSAPDAGRGGNPVRVADGPRAGCPALSRANSPICASASSR